MPISVTLDRTAIYHALAKAIAEKQVGRDQEAEAWARQLIRLLKLELILR